MGHHDRNTEMLAQKIETSCARTDFCSPITIGLSFTCHIAKFETRAFSSTFDYTVNESIQI